MSEIGGPPIIEPTRLEVFETILRRQRTPVRTRVSLHEAHD